MEAAGLPDIVINTFRYYYDQLLHGQTGFIPENDIEPVESVPDSETFPDSLAQTGQEALPHTVMIKLNGGLGTSMGLDRAKSLLKVKNGLSFLDIIARQALTANIPLVLMNSFATRDDSLALLRQYPDLQRDHIPLDFVQHKVPKVAQADLSPVEWPADPDLEWCPPGHGDIYTALVTSGMLTRLLDAGYRYAFVSNVDNLGAALDPLILGYFVQNDLPFMMEVADRTEIDRKGGHLARRKSDGQLILREAAQCLPDDQPEFQNIQKHKYFNTNNLWLNLPVLKQYLEEHNYLLGLPMIRNSKTVDPRDSTSTPVYHLETAMGAAIAVFEGAGAVRVPRTRFAPVKTTNDLLAVRSDAYLLTEDYRIIQNPARKLGQIVIALDPAVYRLIDEMEARFPYGPPSLLDCQRLTIVGDVRFGREVVLKGQVELINPSGSQQVIQDFAVLEGLYRWD
ncbi:MAG: UTP--glucose-1-phosphate uridylyltransferase [Chloroflexi bacterium]|nr:MAG: UTP--glucose-1-phosphate uridylyltransferase [Chloroflexota bacterium]